MKAIRFIVILLLILTTAIVVLGLIAPKEVTVQRTAIINAPKDAVFQQMLLFKNWPNWSPWSKLDPNQVTTYYGNDGQPGSGYKWKGNDKVGEGEMTNTGVKNNEMDFALHFIKPWESNADGFVKVDDAGNNTTKASWGFTTRANFPKNIMFLFINMDKMVGKDFENGLANIKMYVENNKATKIDNAFAIKEAEFPAHTYAAIRKTIAWSDMHQFFASSYGRLGKEAGPRINGPASGIFYSWDTVKHVSDMAAAFPVTDTAKPVTGAILINVPASKAYMAIHVGGYATSGKEHMALSKYLAEKGRKTSWVIEEYVKGPHEEQDSSKWVTNIYYIAK